MRAAKRDLRRSQLFAPQAASNINRGCGGPRTNEITHCYERIANGQGAIRHSIIHFLQRASKISSPRVATHTRQRFISFTRTRDAFNSSSWSESFYLSGKGRRGSLLQRHRSFMFLLQPSCAGNSYYVHRDIMSSLATPLSWSFY
jgi:hypothetical protein